MKWEQLDLTRGEWRIPDTKNKTPQTITLTEEAVIVLQRRKKLLRMTTYFQIQDALDI
jgi:hypothetical protein